MEVFGCSSDEKNTSGSSIATRSARSLKKKSSALQQISAEVKDCKVGPWCKDCQHIGTDDADLLGERLFEYMYIKEKAGRVTYCKKHLHEICPEFERDGR